MGAVFFFIVTYRTVRGVISEKTTVFILTAGETCRQRSGTVLQRLLKSQKDRR
jgi:hypothetical protein